LNCCDHETEKSAQASPLVPFTVAEFHLIYIFIAPDEFIKAPLNDYYAMGISDVKITDLLKSHYDTTKYGLR
jgi:hypothetical protein